MTSGDNLKPVPPVARSLIFISHATPQDNAFALWLGARLASAGYSVWSDVTKLIGGETHWDDITIAIRQHAAKVVSVCSTASVPKKGFKDELSLALAVESQHTLNDFVIPVRLGTIAWGDFPTEIIRRNGIDFNAGWQGGLAKLIKKLEVDAVSRSSATDTDALSKWSKSFLQVDKDVTAADETLLSNVIDVVKGPSAICVSQLKTGAAAPRPELLAWPVETKGKWTYSFARLEQSAPDYFNHHTQLELSHFIENGVSALSLGRQDAYNVVSSLLRQALAHAIQSRGLAGHGFANGRVGFFVAAEESQISPRVSFKGPTGIAGARALNGFSPKNKVFWHYAPELLPVIGPQMCISLAAHVVFTEDGKQALSDVARAHRLRRRFCKSWWQDRWRDMMLAYLSYLSAGQETFEVPLSESMGMTLSTHPVLFVAPVTASTPDTTPPEDEAEDPAVDNEDDDDELSEASVEGQAE